MYQLLVVMAGEKESTHIPVLELIDQYICQRYRKFQINQPEFRLHQFQHGNRGKQRRFLE